MRLIFLLTILFINCTQPVLTLQVTEINENSPLKSDLKDWGINEEGETTYQVYSDLVPVKLIFTSPSRIKLKAECRVERYEVNFGEAYDKVSGFANFYIRYDAEGKKGVEGKILVCPKLWKENYEDEINGKMLNAKIIFEGVRLDNQETLMAEGKLTILFDDWPDDREHFGR